MEGIPFLEIGSVYANAGFEVVFQPEMKSAKKPDIEIINPFSNEKFYIDVAFLKNRDKNEAISIKYQILFNQLHFKAPFLNFSCKQLFEIPDKDLENVLNIIKEAKEKAYNEESFLVINENKYIELAIAHSSKHSELDLWCKERDDRSQDLIGLTLNFDETLRIRKKIKTKGKQIADAGCGLVYIPVHPLYFFVKNPGSIIAEIESKINECPALLGAVIYSKIGHTSEKEVEIKDFHVYTKKMRFPHTQEDLIFVANEKCIANISEETISRIYNTF
ncbi:MAG TPA: hypothetical protein VNW99_10980 [Cytophagaceae bacterium]|nr:hypothetical protein [Cytophagaceae bacterium]